MNPSHAAVSAPERIDRFRGEYAFLSNFHREPFKWQGKLWNTSEAPFQAAKTRDAREAERIRTAPSPAAAKRLGRRVDLRADWDHVKDDVMHSILQAKFAVPRTARRAARHRRRRARGGRHLGRHLLGRLQRQGAEPARAHPHGHPGRHPRPRGIRDGRPARRLVARAVRARAQRALRRRRLRSPGRLAPRRRRPVPASRSRSCRRLETADPSTTR